MTTYTEQNSQNINYDELSIIIHYRKDCQDRERNLSISSSYILNVIKPKELIIINDDANFDEYLRDVKGENHIVKILYAENTGEFKKSYCFNQAATHSSGKVLCFWDVDVVIPNSQILDSYESIINNKFDHVYPFNGIFVDVKKEFIPSIIKIDANVIDFKKLNDELQDTSLGFFNGNVHVISDCSPGGCNLISRSAFESIGGYDDRFIGWGFEDTDFRDRSKIKNRLIYLESGVLWHLNHSTHDDQDRAKQPHYIQNLMIYKTNNKR